MSLVKWLQLGKILKRPAALRLQNSILEVRVVLCKGLRTETIEPANLITTATGGLQLEYQVMTEDHIGDAIGQVTIEEMKSRSLRNLPNESKCFLAGANCGILSRFLFYTGLLTHT